MVIHKFGITICNYLLSQIIKNITIFNEDEQIKTESSLSKVTTATIDEYIISIINDKIYILNDIGELLYKSNEEILEQGETAYYYTLVPIKKKDNYIFYFIGFVHNALLYFLYYEYNYEENTNAKLSKYIEKHKYNSKTYNIVNKGLSCQYMTNSQNINSIICFFLIYTNNYYLLTVDNFLINNDNIIVQDSNYIADHFIFPSIRYIKSCIAKDHSKALVGLILTTGECRYFIFNINVYYNDDYIQNYYFIDQHCRSQYHGLKINYYKEKEEYIYTCIDDNGKILIEMYDENLNIYNYTFKYTDCKEIYGYSIIYSKFKEKYYIISDVNCRGNNYPINLLYGDLKEEENEEKKNDEEKEVDKEEEENDELNDKDKEEEQKNELIEKDEEKEENNELIEEDEEEEENDLLYDEEDKKEEEENGELNDEDIKEEENEQKENSKKEKDEQEIEQKEEEEVEEIEEEIFKNIEYEFCLNQKKKYISSKNKCINNCFEDDNFKYEFKNICYYECPNNTRPSINNICEMNCDSIKLYNNLCKLDQTNFNSKQELIDDIFKNIKNRNLISNESKVIKINNMSLLIAPLNKQQNNDKFISTTTINIGECEQKLRESYHIPENESLIIFKIDAYIEDYIFPVVEYAIFKYETGEKLELDVCEGMKVEISVPINIKDDNLDKYDPSSGFYNDICYTYESLNKTDVSLKDRRNEYIENKLAVCEVDCELKGINKTNQKAICKCNIKINFFQISEIIIDKERLYDSFVNINNIANVKLMQCYHILFTKDGLIYNIGFFIIIPIIILKLISIIIFYKRDFPKIKLIIIQIVNTKKYIKRKSFNKKNVHKNQKSKDKINQINNLEKKKLKKIPKKVKVKNNLSNKKNKIKKSKRKTKKNISDRIGLKNSNQNKNIETEELEEKIDKKRKINSPPIKSNKPYKTNKRNKRNKRKNKPFINILKTNGNDLSDKTGKGFEKSNFEINPLKTQKEGKEDLKSNMNILKYNDLELNSCNYEEAVKIDKRTFIEYYFSLLLTNHLLLFPFQKNDYNSFIIKLDFFFFSFVLYYSINAMFFNDNTMHKIYEDGGSFNFIYQIPQIIYSSLISSTFHTILKSLSLSEKNILDLKNEKDLKHLDKKSNDIIKNLSLKFSLYFILSSGLLLFCWYYLSCFCAVYKNTQIHLIKDTVISFGLSLIYPLLFFLVPGIFRIPSLQRKNSQCLYNFSKLIQMIV